MKQRITISLDEDQAAKFDQLIADAVMKIVRKLFAI